MTARPRQARGASRVGERFEGVVGPIAHGGHCVVRLEDGPVVFTRHALPGERVVVEITEGTDGDRFWRGDAVTVLEASPDRAPPPCPYAGPGLCGGCDFQHVALPTQRQLKAHVVAEQLRRLAGLDLDVEVEAVPGDVDGLRWRTRQRFARLPDGRKAMRKHRSHDLVPVDDCLIATSTGPATTVRGRSFGVAEGGFWQVHPGAPEVLVTAVLEALAPRPGESVLDLYAGVGLFAAFVAEAAGSTRVVAIEGDRAACDHASQNLREGAEVVCGLADRVLRSAYDEPFDLVVLDPPRAGAKRRVVEQVVARAPRAVAYVACDPAALARDVAIFAEHGYALTSLRAFDLFPMTHHVECVALLEPGPFPGLDCSSRRGGQDVRGREEPVQVAQDLVGRPWASRRGHGSPGAGAVVPADLAVTVVRRPDGVQHGGRAAFTGCQDEHGSTATGAPQVEEAPASDTDAAVDPVPGPGRDGVLVGGRGR